MNRGTARRIIARLDIKAPNLVKGIQLEGLRVVGDPTHFAELYAAAGIDELLYIDIVASLYERNTLDDLIARAAREIFVPLTVSGGIRTVADMGRVLRSGADKVALNTAAIANPALLGEAARAFGSQSVVLSVEAKQVGPLRWEAYTDNGRGRTGVDVVEWVKRAVDLGAGEVLVTSVDRDGTRRGLDCALIREVARDLPVPLIAGGGAGSAAHVVAAFEAGADAVAVGALLHSCEVDVKTLKAAVAAVGLEVRMVP